MRCDSCAFTWQLSLPSFAQDLLLLLLLLLPRRKLGKSEGMSPGDSSQGTGGVWVHVSGYFSFLTQFAILAKYNTELFFNSNFLREVGGRDRHWASLLAVTI